MPLPPGLEPYTEGPPSKLPSGLETDITGRTAASKRNLERPPSRPGPASRFLAKLGVPTTMEGFVSTLNSINPSPVVYNPLSGSVELNPATQMLPGIAQSLGNEWQEAWDQAGSAVDAFQHGEYGNAVKHAAGFAIPFAGPNLVSGDIAGGLGELTNLALARKGLASTDAARLRATAPPVTPKIERTIPVTVGDKPGMASRIGQAAYELLPIPRGIKATRALMGRGNAPSAGQTVEVPFTETPSKPAPPAPKFSGTDFPLNTAALGSDLPQPTGSGPLNPPALVDRLLQPPPPSIWNGPVPPSMAADFGNAPRQTAAGPVAQMTRANQVRTARSLDDAGMAARFEPGDLSSRVTGDMAPPPLNPQELAGVQSQVNQTAGAMNPFEPLSSPIPKTTVVDDAVGAGEGAQLPAAPSMVVDVSGLNGLRQMMMEKYQKLNSAIDGFLQPGDPTGVLPPGPHLQNHRTSQLAKIEAEKMGWDRENLHRPSASKGNRPIDAKRKLEIAETERNASAIDRAGKSTKGKK